MIAETPLNESVEIRLDDALRNPTLKKQEEMYPWRMDYANLDYSGDNITAIEISKQSPTLSHVLLPALEATNSSDKALARKKFRAILASLVQAHFNPDKVQIDDKISLKDNVLYIERKSKTAPKVALKLKDDANVVDANELKKDDEEVVEKSQRSWNDLGDAISKGIIYDVIVAMYKTKDSKANFAKRKELWEDEMKETDKFTGSPAQNKEILGFLKTKRAEVTAAPAAAATPDAAAEPAAAPAAASDAAPAPAAASDAAPAPAAAPETAPDAPAAPAPDAPAAPAAPAPEAPAPEAPAPEAPAPAPAPAAQQIVPEPNPWGTAPNAPEAPAAPAPAPAPEAPAPAAQQIVPEPNPWGTAPNAPEAPAAPASSPST